MYMTLAELCMRQRVTWTSMTLAVFMPQERCMQRTNSVPLCLQVFNQENRCVHFEYFPISFQAGLALQLEKWENPRVASVLNVPCTRFQ